MDRWILLVKLHVVDAVAMVVHHHVGICTPDLPVDRADLVDRSLGDRVATPTSAIVGTYAASASRCLSMASNVLHMNARWIV